MKAHKYIKQLITNIKELIDNIITDFFRTFYPKAATYTFFSSARGTFSRIDDILGHKLGLNKYKKAEIISCIFSFFFFYIFYNIYLFLRDRERKSMSRGGGETDTHTESEAGSRL